MASEILNPWIEQFYFLFSYQLPRNEQNWFVGEKTNAISSMKYINNIYLVFIPMKMR